jgi:hypothetical protein
MERRVKEVEEKYEEKARLAFDEAMDQCGLES